MAQRILANGSSLTVQMLSCRHSPFLTVLGLFSRLFPGPKRREIVISEVQLFLLKPVGRAPLRTLMVMGVIESLRMFS